MRGSSRLNLPGVAHARQFKGDSWLSLENHESALLPMNGLNELLLAAAINLCETAKKMRRRISNSNYTRVTYHGRR